MVLHNSTTGSTLKQEVKIVNLASTSHLIYRYSSPKKNLSKDKPQIQCNYMYVKMSWRIKTPGEQYTQA